MLPTSERRGSVLPRSYKDMARKAFEKLTKPVLPGTYLAWQKAIAAEARSYDKKTVQVEEQARDLDRERRAAAAAAASAAAGDTEPDGFDAEVEALGALEDLDGSGEDEHRRIPTTTLTTTPPRTATEPSGALGPRGPQAAQHDPRGATHPPDQRETR